MAQARRQSEGRRARRNQVEGIDNIQSYLGRGHAFPAGYLSIDNQEQGVRLYILQILELLQKFVVPVGYFTQKMLPFIVDLPRTYLNGGNGLFICNDF